MKIVINKCFGGFGISDTAYEKLIEWGVPLRKYEEQTRNPETGLFLPQPANDGEVIFDRELTLLGESSASDVYHKYKGHTRVMQRYWETWLSNQRSHPMLLRAVKELGEAANGHCAKLEIVEIPDGVDYAIDEYDGMEHIAEKHRTWG